MCRQLDSDDHSCFQFRTLLDVIYWRLANFYDSVGRLDRQSARYLLGLWVDSDNRRRRLGVIYEQLFRSGSLAWDRDRPLDIPNEDLVVGLDSLVVDDEGAPLGERYADGDANVVPVDASRPRRAGEDIGPPARTHDRPPVYPRFALEAGVQGVVVLEMVIDTDGAICQEPVVLRPVDPIFGLYTAAVEAVKNWTYALALVDGEPVPVIMTITVNFTIQ